MASTVLDARETPRAPSSPDRRRPPATVLATVLGSGVAFLDTTVVNVSLPRCAW